MADAKPFHPGYRAAAARDHGEDCPIKALHVFKVYLPDDNTGVPRVIHEIAERLTPHGVQSDVLALSPSPSATPIRIGSHVVHQAKQDVHLASTGLSWSAFGIFRRLAAQADVIHYHFPWPFADCLHFAGAGRTPSVVTYHSDVVKQRLIGLAYRPLMHAFLGRMDAVVATSQRYAETSPVLARHADRVRVIPIGLPPRPAVDPALVAEWRERVGAGFFLFVGALRYYKGLPFLVEAARRSGLPVVIAGKGDVAALGSLPPNLRVLGAVSDADKEALLTLCGAFVFPSHLRSEAFGVALVEAARAARAMICCEIGTGTSHVNANGETGLVVQPADPQALAEAMRRMHADPVMTQAMGQAAEARFKRLFTAEAMGESYARLYRDVLAKHGK